MFENLLTSPLQIYALLTNFGTQRTTNNTHKENLFLPLRPSDAVSLVDKTTQKSYLPATVKCDFCCIRISITYEARLQWQKPQVHPLPHLYLWVVTN